MARSWWFVGFALGAALCVSPLRATASEGWPRPVDGATLLVYGASYQAADGGSCAHGGLDIAGDAGEAVRSCVAGAVTFAGRVPAGEGAQAFAVTVLTPDGLRVTYLPLRSAGVTKGQHVGAGEPIGSLAEDGDASSEGTHLHLGVRRGEARLDPAGFLGEPAALAPEPPAAALSAPAAPVTGRSATASTGSHASAVAPAAANAPAASAEGQLSPRVGLTLEDEFAEAGRSASSALARVPMLRRVRELGDAPVLDTARMWADVRAGRGWIGRAALCLALALVAGACAVPALRAVRAASGERTVPLALVRRDGR